MEVKITDYGLSEDPKKYYVKYRVFGIDKGTLDKLENKIEDKTIIKLKQDDSISTYAPMLKKETSLINWNDSAKNVHNMVRGLNPDQLAYFVYEDKNVKVYKTSYNYDECEYEPGTVIKADKTGIYVKTGDGTIIVKELQMPGKNKMSVEDYLRGNKFPEMIKL